MDGYDEYYMDDMHELDEQQEKLLQVSNCMGCFAGADFETAFQNACYMCDVDPEEFDEWDLQELEESYGQ